MGAETTQVHTRLLKCALEVEGSRAYWRRVAPPSTAATAVEAFEGFWFGAKSLPRVKVLLTNFRARFDAFPDALQVLQQWHPMDPEVRALICHWHLQLSDPLYRGFTGEFLPHRRATLRPDIRRDLVIEWVGDQGPGRWTMSTRIQFASKLLSAAFAAGLLRSKRDPREAIVPRVPDEALTYLVYLLRSVEFEGTLLDNPYSASVGLDCSYLEERLRGSTDLQFQRQGDLVDFGWRFDSLTAWREAR